MIDWLMSIPVICLVGLVFCVALIFVPIGQFIERTLLIRKYGKDTAEEILRRF